MNKRTGRSQKIEGFNYMAFSDVGYGGAHLKSQNLEGGGGHKFWIILSYTANSRSA